jgi:hypothetical protein
MRTIIWSVSQIENSILHRVKVSIFTVDNCTCYINGREESTFLMLDPANLFITFLQDPCEQKVSKFLG